MSIATDEWIIDADSHITEPPDVWTSRVAKKYVGQVPHLTRTDDGRDTWMMGGKSLSGIGFTAPAGWPAFPPGYPPTFDDLHPASHDGAARVKYMDDERIWGQVLYPNVAGFGSQNFLELPDFDLRLACVRAYNDFLRDWVSPAPDRFVTVVSTPFWDIDATVAEVERCAQLGHRGILFTGEPQRFGLPFLADKHWDPLWSVAQAAGMPIHFHIGGGDNSDSESVIGRFTAQGWAGASGYTAVDLFMKNGVQCADLILSGILPRFPDLKFVSVESGIGWIPFMLEAADYSYLGAFQPGRHRTEELLPSELFYRQVYCTYWFEKVAPLRLLADLPVDNILFETDFPHTACLYGNIRETIDAGLADAPEEIRHKFLWANSAKLYGFSEPAVVGV